MYVLIASNIGHRGRSYFTNPQTQDGWSRTFVGSYTHDLQNAIVFPSLQAVLEYTKNLPTSVDIPVLFRASQEARPLTVLGEKVV